MEKYRIKSVGVSPVMKRYLEFLMWHHNYSWEKLLTHFPNYIEKVKS
jgi:hypothetical protein